MFNCVYCAHRNSPVCKECIGWNRYQDIRFDIDRELDIIHRETEKRSTIVSMRIKKLYLMTQRQLYFGKMEQNL